MIQSKDYENSIIYLEKCLKYQTSNPMVFNNLGIALKDKGYLAAAILSYRKALKINPSYAKAYFHLGIAHKDRGETKTSLENYKKL